MDLGLKDKVVFVTGAGSGIGRATALTFAEEGCLVAVSDLNEAGATATAREIAERGGKAFVVVGDVSKWADVERMVKATVAEFGHVDILANVAGAWRINFFMQTEREDWDFEIEVNYKGVLNCTRAALEEMVPRRSGCIVSVSSDAGRGGEPNQPVYSGAKAAVIGFSKGIAKDVARHKIRVNVVCPSMTLGEKALEQEAQMRAEGDQAKIQLHDDRMAKIVKTYPLRKLGTPQDVANMIVYLASDLRCGHVTGQTVSVNGGYLMP